MRPFRPFIMLFMLAALLLPAHAGLAAANPLTALSHPSAAKAAAPAPLDSAQIDAAVATLNNPQQRAALIAALEAMKAQQQATQKKTGAAGVGLGLAQNIQRETGIILSDFGAALKSATDVSLIWHWMVFVATDIWLRQTVIRAAWRLALVVASGLVGEYLMMFALRRPRAGILRRAAIIQDARRTERGVEGIAAAEAGESEKRPRKYSLRRWFRRLPYAIGHFGLSLLPILVFAAIGFAFLSTRIADERVSRLVLIAVVNAYLVCRLVLEIARFVLAPEARQIRLFRTTDRRAQWMVCWLRRVIATIAFGYATIVTGGLFGLYPAARLVLAKLVSLIVHIMAAIMILQARKPVAAIIMGKKPGNGFIAALRFGLSKSWHVLALFYVVALWIAWAIGVPHAFAIMLRIVVVFAVVSVGARAIAAWFGQGLDTLFDDDVIWRGQYPGLYARGRTYTPVLKVGIGSVLSLIAVLVILQLWGIGVLAWLTGNPIGQRVLSAGTTIGLVVLISLLVWEAVNAGMEGHAEKLVRLGRPGRATRYRTLLPMLRSTLFTIIVVIAVLVVLAAVGVNVTLLLGGLSIFGLALGFGSQKLVQDIITGLFLLLEDAMQVGDWVTLAGISGSVEKLSIRTIRLRSGDGALNIIPFSSVTTVANSSREFCYAPLNVGVAYKEDIDRVQAIIREIFDTLRADPTYAPQIIADLELWGLDQFGASSVNIVGRVRTPAGKQHSVRREFNRRIKIRFDAEGIEIPFTYQRITIDPAEFRAAFGPPRQPKGEEPAESA